MEIKNTSKTARVHRPERFQIEMRFDSLDQLLPADHRVRDVWKFVQGLDLEPFYEDIEVTEHTAGRTPLAPEIYVALWLLATLDGIGKGRELNRRCATDIVYQWVLGGGTTNYHSLSDFRTKHGKRLDALLVDTVASLVHSGVVPLETVAQDGMRVGAAAGKSSFRRKPTLEALQQEAQVLVDRLKKERENETDSQDGDARQEAAAERAAREKLERINEALRQHEELRQRREARTKGEGEKTRVSTTDPEARNMKVANGGYEPSFNVQFVTDGDTRVIVAVEVTNEGTDGGHLPPLMEEVRETYGKTPKQVLVDSAYATKEGVTQVEQAGIEVVSSVPRAEQLQKHGKDPHARQSGDTEEYVRFRQRMADPAKQTLYKQRPSIAEFPNADCRNRNLKQFNVRGIVKATAVALWHALAFNFLRLLDLGVLAR
jgi:transposase